MGYATVMHVPRVTDYNTALEIWGRAVPIRGRSPELRPLGNRRDADTYSIRKNDQECVELVNYETPVITFTPDGRVVLFTAGYNSVSTHQFIQRVLGIEVRSIKRHSVLTLGEHKYTLDGQNKLVLNLEGGSWRCVDGAKQNSSLTLDRKAVTNVRSKYSEFYTYFKGMVNLRKQDNAVVVYEHEITNLFGEGGVGNLNFITEKPHHCRWTTPVAKVGYEAGIKELFELIKNDQPNDTKSINFYKASVAVMLNGPRMYWAHNYPDGCSVRASALCKLMDTVVLKAHAEEVLVRKLLPIGKVSAGTYDKWMD
jgi:hypothetical protein